MITTLKRVLLTHMGLIVVASLSYFLTISTLENSFILTAFKALLIFIFCSVYFVLGLYLPETEPESESRSRNFVTYIILTSLLLIPWVYGYTISYSEELKNDLDWFPYLIVNAPYWFIIEHFGTPPLPLYSFIPALLIAFGRKVNEILTSED